MNYLILLIACFTSYSWALKKNTAKMVLIPGGEYLPFLESELVKKSSISDGAVEKIDSSSRMNQKKVTTRVPKPIAPFWLDPLPVTVADYLEFVKKNPRWRKSQLKTLFADSHYLDSWSGDLNPSAPWNSPVTQVSWFGAMAYCESLGKTLPTIDQWEYTAYDRGRNQEAVKNQILEWYGKPNQKKMKSVGLSPKNGYGIYDLHGLIWEWTFDFNNLMISSESRTANSRDTGLFCGAGSLNALDASDYAAFMRFSFRNSLKGNYTTANLGFRCAKEMSRL